MRKSGVFTTDKQWQVRFFEFCRSKQEHNTSLVANEESLTTSVTSERVRELKMKDLERETGQSVLMLGGNLHDKVVFVKKQLA